MVILEFYMMRRLFFIRSAEEIWGDLSLVESNYAGKCFLVRTRN